MIGNLFSLLGIILLVGLVAVVTIIVAALVVGMLQVAYEILFKKDKENKENDQ